MIPPENLGDVGESIFAEYLDRNCISYKRHEPAGNAHPDYWVAHERGPIVCEVKSLQASLPPNSAGALDVYTPLRKAIKKAARQGTDVKGHHPYVLVIYAPRWPTDEIAVAGAMFGNVGVTFPVGPSVADGYDHATTAFLQGGRLQSELNTRFSAVAVCGRINPGQLLLDRKVRDKALDMPLEDVIKHAMEAANELEAAGLLSDDERVARVDVYMNPFAAVTLPEDLFVGPFDRMYSVDERGAFSLRMMGTSLEGFDS